MTEKSLKELIEEQFEANSTQLPVFNRVALELQQLRGDDKVSMEQIAAVIIKDQSMASRVLQVANSSFYGGLKKVETITQAVVRLGLKRVTTLAMVASQLLSHQSEIAMIANLDPGPYVRAALVIIALYFMVAGLLRRPA